MSESDSDSELTVSEERAERDGKSPAAGDESEHDDSESEESAAESEAQTPVKRKRGRPPSKNPAKRYKAMNKAQLQDELKSKDKALKELEAQLEAMRKVPKQEEKKGSPSSVSLMCTFSKKELRLPVDCRMCQKSFNVVELLQHMYSINSGCIKFPADGRFPTKVEEIGLVLTPCPNCKAPIMDMFGGGLTIASQGLYEILGASKEVCPCCRVMQGTGSEVVSHLLHGGCRKIQVRCPCDPTKCAGITFAGAKVLGPDGRVDAIKYQEACTSVKATALEHFRHCTAQYVCREANCGVTLEIGRSNAHQDEHRLFNQNLQYLAFGQGYEALKSNPPVLRFTNAALLAQFVNALHQSADDANPGGAPFIGPLPMTAAAQSSTSASASAAAADASADFSLPLSQSSVAATAATDLFPGLNGDLHSESLEMDDQEY